MGLEPATQPQVGPPDFLGQLEEKRVNLSDETLIAEQLAEAERN